MAGITLAIAEAKLITWLAAEDAIATNQSYSIGNRTLARADLEFVRETVNYWDAKVKNLSSRAGRSGGIRVMGAIPID